MGERVHGGRALLVDPEIGLLADVGKQLQEAGFVEVRSFATPSQALCAEALSDGVDLLFTEVDFGDETCLELLDAAGTQSPTALCIVASSRATRALVAEAMRHGADGYLDKPVVASAFAFLLAEQRSVEAECEHFARELVGRVGMRVAQSILREAMLQEAMRRTSDSRRATAGLLGIDRRCVQRMIADLDAGPLNLDKVS